MAAAVAARSVGPPTMTTEGARRHGHHAGGATASGCWRGCPSRSGGWSSAGVSTAVLEGGDGPPLVLLHGPAGNATHWMRVDPATSWRRIASSPPTCRATAPRRSPAAATSTPTRARDWLDELIERTCAVAAGAGRLRARRRDRRPLRRRPRRPAQPAGARGRARPRRRSRPRRSSARALARLPGRSPTSARTTASGATARSTSTACASAWASDWEPFEAYNLDRARHAERRSRRSTA